MKFFLTFAFTSHITSTTSSFQNTSFTPLSITSLVELNGQLFAPVLGLKEECKKICETQVLIPYTVGNIIYAFEGLLNTTSSMDHSPTFPV